MLDDASPRPKNGAELTPPQNLEAQTIVRHESDGPRRLSFPQERLFLLDRIMPGLGAYNVPHARARSGDARRGRCCGARSTLVVDAARDPPHADSSSSTARPSRRSFRRAAVRPDRRRPALAPARRGAGARRRAARRAGRPSVRRSPATSCCVPRLVHLAPGRGPAARRLPPHGLRSRSQPASCSRSSTSSTARCRTAASRSCRSCRSSTPTSPSGSASRLDGDAPRASCSTTGRRSCAGVPDRLDLPSDRPRPSVQSYRGAWTELDDPAEVVAPLRELARATRRLAVHGAARRVQDAPAPLHRRRGPRRSARPSPVATTRRPRSCSASSPTRSRCAPTSPAIRPSRSCCSA